MDIDRFLPTYDVFEKHGTRVDAPADRIYQAIRSLDVRRSRIIRTLLRMRGIPPRAAGLQGLVDFGFILLRERPPAEICLGLVGRFWTLRGDLQRIPAEEFGRFERDGFAKVAWNFHIETQAGSPARLSTETRIQCFGAKSLRRFRWYWRLIAPFSGWTRREMLRLVKQAAEREEAA